MENPVTYSLLRTNTRPIDLANQLKLSRQYISRAELGCHLNLSDKLIRWIVIVVNQMDEAEMTSYEVIQWYQQFQAKKRTSTYNRLDLSGLPPAADIISHSESFKNAFIKWRRERWETSYLFSKDLCVHPGSVDNYELGKVRKIPNDLMAVLVWIERRKNGR
jgi:hypothetical protein